MKLSLTINGDPYRENVESAQTLLGVLRDDIGLTGTKWGCLTGDCGSCTVLVDGRTVVSCLQLAAQVDGSTITTVEGLAGRGRTMSDLQGAFVRHGAAQCGFCTPGMLVAAEQLIRDGIEADEKSIREGLSGNLCRCTGYNKIIDAVVEIAATRG